ncbi:MAG: protein adenylyltransferase SelO family protein, partial [Saprospiraceae bacterium]|nr:protein adenylyltransferase SelO family protein [Saprospiraceae bacterium]
WTPNTTDNGQRRYRYGYQPHIALWNLAQLANAMLLLIEDPKPLEAIIEKYKIDYHLKYVEMMKSKLGLTEENETDKGLISELEDLLQMTETDMTIFFRSLAKINKVKMKGEGKEFLDPLLKAFYEPEKINYELTDSWRSWLNKYIDRLGQESTSNEERKTKMDKVNPKYVLRNYMAQLAIDKADNGDYSLIDDLYQMLKTPYDEQPKNEKWFTKRPEWARNKVGCSMLSCSS